ncbi:MAG: hypothetical protein ACI9MR_003863 [Myxococcota bacterium]|jgi:hypothetical protein
MPFAVKHALKRMLTLPRRLARGRIRAERARVGQRRRILVVARDPLMANYGNMVTRTLDPQDADIFRASTLTDVIRASLHWWDLVIFTDHGTALLFAPAVPKLFVGHGFGSGKIVDGQPYRHGPQWTLDRDRSCLYDVILEPSARAVSCANAINPALAPHLRVVGDPIVDRLTEMSQDRVACRARLGLTETASATLMISTWGPHALVTAPGFWSLLENALNTQNVLLSVHPRQWSSALAERATALGAHVLSPSDDWRPAIVACDQAVVDHTAMSLYVAAMGKPVSFGPIPGSQLDPRSLEAALRRCKKGSAYATFTQSLVDHRGASTQQIRAVVLDLLT